MSAKNIHILARDNIDSAGSVLCICWAYPDASISYSIYPNTNSFRSKFNNKNLKKYDVVFAVDLFLKEEDLPLVDKDNVIYITKVDCITNLCKTIKAVQSCTATLYKLLKNKLDITKEQKLLAGYVIDAASFTRNFPKSESYSILCSNMGVLSFVHEFAQGHKIFSKEQSALIYNHKLDSERYIKDLSYYSTKIPISVDNTSKEVLFIGTFANKFIDEVTSSIYEQYPDCEVSFIVNTETERVYFRRRPDSVVKLNLLAKKLCNGGGLEYASSGRMTDDFINFTKRFQCITLKC
jgi:hypothetical protein